MGITELGLEVWDYLLTQTYPRVIELVEAPVFRKEMLWIVVPLVLTLFLIQVYFGRHREEELGWNTAYGNAIALIFVSVSLVRYLFERYGSDAIFNVGQPQFSKFLIVVVLFGIAFDLMLIDFTHSISKRFAFFISNSAVVTTAAYSAIVLVHTDVPMDKHTAWAVFALFFLVYIVTALIKWIIPPSEEAREYLTEKSIKRRRLLQKRKKEISEYISNFIQSVKNKFSQR